jgi:hypothetical protein
LKAARQQGGLTLPSSPVKAVFTILFGVAVVAGGWAALCSNKWPLYLPIPFDAVEASFSIFGDRFGICVVSAAVLLVGL